MAVLRLQKLTELSTAYARSMHIGSSPQSSAYISTQAKVD